MNFFPIASNKIEIKKSKFISYLFETKTILEAKSILDNIKLEHKKAKHICYGFKIANTIKYYNSSEPAKVALYSFIKPIQKNNLDNILALTIRYYGGIKLGSGVLLRAYLSAVEPCFKFLVAQKR